MPSEFSEKQKEQLFQLILAVQKSVASHIPVGFSFFGNSRVILPHNVFLQNKTPRTSAIFHNRFRDRSFTGMLPVKNDAEQYIGMDAYQVFSQESESRNGWKVFNLSQIDDLRLHALEEVRSIFDLEGDYIWEGADLVTGFDTIRDFVPDWNILQRKFLSQVPPTRDIRSIRSRKSLQRVAE
ncbi:hypothetical protein HOO68_03650 [Candidatus Gracilibacteria bacterium]|nr:hypothetical protein [Candidatus Gracilibacteria bacterium]